MDLKLPITIHDGLDEQVIESTGMLDLASGEIRDVKYVNFDTEAAAFRPRAPTTTSPAAP